MLSTSVSTWRLCAIAAATTLALAGCGKEEPKPAAPVKAAEPAKPAEPPPTVVKIGHVGPLTGSIAHLGKDNENGVRLAIDEANARGVTLDGKKVTFELMGEDDQADPKVGATVAQKTGRRQGRRRGRPPQFRRHHSGVGNLQQGRHPDDFRLGH